ncbi:polyketide synthase type I [Pelomyxa schiedti]|nr:polyketide synthase type I [Pelomyxa schiedti]
MLQTEEGMDWKSQLFSALLFNSLQRAAVICSAPSGSYHMLFEKPPELPPTELMNERKDFLMLFSALTETAVEEYSKRVLGTLSSKDINRVLLTEAEYTLQVGRERFQKRRAVVVRLKRNGEKDTIDSVFAPPKSKTNASAQSQLATDNSKEPQIAFLFSGFGGTHVHAIRELYAAFPTFRRNFDRCSISIAKLMDIDPRTMLQTEEGMDWKSQLFSALLFNSLQVCVALQLIEWGIKPTMGMIAHSLGEYGAAVVSGVMTVEESLFLCHKRFTLLATLPAAAVLFVSLYPVQKIKEIIASIPNCSMEITVINSEMHCLVCGTPDEITTLRAKIHEDTATSGYFLNDFNSTPSHSSRAGPILETFADSILTRVKMNKPTIRYVSCSSCKWVDSTEATTPQHYCHHLSHPILFPTGMECLLQTWSEQEAPPRLVILEIGTSLASHVTQIIGQRNATCIPAMLHNKNNKLNAAQQLLAAAATLWEQGAELDWESYHVGTRNLYKVSLPTYPWERKQCEPPAEPGSAAETLADQDKSFLQILHSKSGKSDQSSDENDAASGTAELFSGKAQVPKELVAAVMEYWTAHAVVTPADMREDSTFFAGGAASMNAMQMLSSLNNKYHIVIPGRVFFAEPTFEHLLTLIHPLVQQQQPQQQVQQQLLRAQQTTPTDQSNETNNSSHTERVATAPAPSSSTNNNNNL